MSQLYENKNLQVKICNPSSYPFIFFICILYVMYIYIGIQNLNYHCVQQTLNDHYLGTTSRRPGHIQSSLQEGFANQKLLTQTNVACGLLPHSNQIRIVNILKDYKRQKRKKENKEDYVTETTCHLEGLKYSFVEKVCHSLLQGKESKRQTITYATREDSLFQ